MANKKNISICKTPSTIDELVDDMEKYPVRYKHLQFILNRRKHNRWGLGQRYLLINHNGFGVYQLNMVDYNNGFIQMILTNPDTGKPSKINLNINNKHPDIYLINWKDIEDIVLTGRNFDCADDELLELEDE